MGPSKRLSFIMCGGGVFLIVVGVVLGFFWPLIFGEILKQNLELGPESESYKLWRKTPIPMYLEIYLFNWTNSEEFLANKKVKPEFKEVGPFVFREVHERVGVIWNDNYTVTYNQTRKWNYVPEKSIDLNTPITNLNVIATTVTKMALKYKNILQALIEFLTLFYKEKLLITRPANEWLFDGMPDKLLDFIKRFTSIQFDKFGWFYGRNLSATYDGKFNVMTGKDSVYNLGVLSSWNNMNRTNYFEGECAEVKGSSGELFAPLSDSQKNLTFFITDFCGPLTLNYSGPTTFEGVNGNRYVGSADVFDNGTQYPKSKCFCTGKCSPSGVRNITLCRQAPLFISYPHFYLADPVYTESVKGMQPNKSLHEFFIEIDPVTGIPLEVKAQLQINVLLEPLKHFSMFSDVPEVYVPALWFRQTAKISSELILKDKSTQMYKKLGLYLFGGCAIAGLLVVIVWTFWFKLSHRKEAELLITEAENQLVKNESEGEG